MSRAFEPSASRDRPIASPSRSQAPVNRVVPRAGLLLMAALPLLLGASAPSPEFQAITSRVSQQSHDASCEQMLAWIAAHPTEPNAGRGLIWMGQLRLADGRLDLAFDMFSRAEREYADTEWGPHGAQGRANVDLIEHHFQKALDTYAQLAARPEPYWQYVGRTALHDGQQLRVRFIAYVVLVIALLLWAIVRLAMVKRRWPPPEELSWSAPVLIVMLVAARAQPPAEAHAVVLLALGAAVLLWSNGAFLRERPPGRRWPLEAVLAIAQASALLYCCVMASDLWVKFAETLSAGAER